MQKSYSVSPENKEINKTAYMQILDRWVVRRVTDKNAIRRKEGNAVLLKFKISDW